MVVGSIVKAVSGRATPWVVGVIVLAAAVEARATALAVDRSHD